MKFENSKNNPQKWTDHCEFKLIIDDKSAVDYNFIDLKFHYFHEPQAPFIRRIMSNMYMNGLSPGIIGYSEDSSKRSLAPDIEIFMKKSLGVAIFQLENPELECIVDCIEIDALDLPELPISIGDSVLMYGSGFNVYSPEYFSMAIDKGYISQIIGHGESYLCNMTITGSSQCYPIWKESDDSLVGLKLPVFINHKNMYTYSFILSIRCLVESLTYGNVKIPESVTDHFSVISESIVKIRAGGHYGTGVIIHPEGYVLTNRHVVENCETIVVNEEYDAKLFCCSTGLYDLALIKMIPTKKPGESLQSLPVFKILLPYTGRLKLDLKVDYFTTGYGLWSIIKAPAFSKGYLRKLVMHTDKQGEYRCQFVAHSCDLYDGSSGGPLINSIGQVIGINFQNIKYNYFDKEKQTKTIIYSKLGFAISHEVFSEIYSILFNSGLTEDEKQEFIQGHYSMSYQGEPLMH